MKKRNSVFIATSIDGFIADKNGGIAWLNSIPNPDNLDMGYVAFMETVDAIVMGRNTFEIVCSFDMDWPYTIHVFVLSNSLKEISEEYQNKAFLVSGGLDNILDSIHQKGFNSLYIDGGATIQNFLKEDLIDDLILSTIPVILGEGIPLFSSLPEPLNFELKNSRTYLNQLVQRHYKRKK